MSSQGERQSFSGLGEMLGDSRSFRYTRSLFPELFNRRHEAAPSQFEAGNGSLISKARIRKLQVEDRLTP